MIANLLDRNFLLDHLQNVEAELNRLKASEPETSRRSTSIAGEEPELTEEDYVAALTAVKQIREAGAPGQLADDIEAPEDSRLDEKMFLGRDPVLSLLQSALEEWIETEQPEAIETIQPDASLVGRRRAAEQLPEITDRRLAEESPDRRLAGPFEVTDYRWVTRVGLAYGLKLLRDRHPFNPEPAAPVELAEKARLVIVGDWGSGLPRAQRVGELMRKQVEAGMDEGLQVHVVHLGDVYYSGWKREVEKRLLAYWPVEPDEAHEVYSWSLNGNHDMYSGGYGYFDCLLADPRFRAHNRSSWFSIENQHWRIVGLDTAWDERGIHDPRTEHGLAAPQGDQLTRMAAQDSRPFMLLSHHQLFSAFEKTGAYLQSQLQPLLDAERIRAWFWGHEHKCIAYESFAGVEYGRCVGHGGVPVYPPSAVPDRDPRVRWVSREAFDGWIEQWAQMGFAVADFNGADVQVRYLDENGEQPWSEDFSAA